jgi:hypothetical protein
MKKTLLLLTFISAATLSFAQTIGVGIKGGLNLSSQSASDGGTTASSSTSTGFHVGGFVDVGLGSWSIQPSLLYTTKGAKSDDSKLTLNYIEVPVDVLYHIPVGVGNIFIGAGPYAALGINGKIKGPIVVTATSGLSSSMATSVYESDVTYGSGPFDFKKLDYGINAMGGLKLANGLLFSVGYDFGLANVINDNNIKLKNNTFMVSVGFSFL